MVTEHKIRTFVGEQNFQKGQQAFLDGAIVNPEQQATALKAYCYDSLPEPFRVQVTFDGSGITATLCSCPAGTLSYGTRGCEHTAALLLAWKEQPEAFTQTDDIDTILERQSKAQLITLIKQLLQKQPEVEWELTMPVLATWVIRSNKDALLISSPHVFSSLSRAFRNLPESVRTHP
jgi:uncharacterized Zn finger protein